MATCSHLDTVEIVDAPADVAGWHHQSTGHPIIRSAEAAEAGEDWSWCYVDELMFRMR